MDDTELKNRLAIHMAQHSIAVFAQWVAGIAGTVSALWHGKPSMLVLGLAGAAFFHLAKPGADQELTRALDARDKEAGG